MSLQKLGLTGTLLWLLGFGGCLGTASGCASAQTAGNYKAKSGTVATQFVIDVQTGGFKIGIGFPGHVDFEGEGKYSAGKPTGSPTPPITDGTPPGAPP